MTTPLVSIVMGYYNRKPQCLCTLDTINNSVIASKIEVIIVDDASDPEHDLSSIPNRYRFPIKLLKIPKELKNWHNPVIAYNLGLAQASGDWIIIQNPEVCHIGDICSYVSQSPLGTNAYLAFQVFACHDEATSATLRSRISDLGWVQQQLETPAPHSQLKGQWYCHPRFRARAYHFCTAIHKTKLALIGGFNSAMKDGVDYDDDELLARIERVCRVNFVTTVKLYGIHQWHPKFSYQHPNTESLRVRNRMLYQKTVTNRHFVRVDIQGDIPTAVRTFVNGPNGWKVLSLDTQPQTLMARPVPMKKDKVIVTITGIRPDFIRMSEVFKRLDASFTHIMIHTGQHYDTYLSDAFFRDLKIRAPDYHLETGVKSSNHYEQLSYLSVAVVKCIKDNNIKPDLVLFLGDSNTSAVALPLKKEGYRIGHIEAGMRSGDRRMLEEINRTVCDVCSDIFLVYHADNEAALLKEGVNPTQRPIHVVGNTIVEVCQSVVDGLQLFSRPKNRNMIIMDIHRPENFNDIPRLRSIFAFANTISAHYRLPVKCLHFKRLLDQINAHQIDLGCVEIIPLLSYPDYLTLVYHAQALISDSGTGQEEPALLKTPVIVPRDYTERPQSYQNECSIRLPLDCPPQQALTDIVGWVDKYSTDKLGTSIKWLGDGNTATRIIEAIAKFVSS